jgi:hypothetical protein
MNDLVVFLGLMSGIGICISILLVAFLSKKGKF